MYKIFVAILLTVLVILTITVSIGAVDTTFDMMFSQFGVTFDVGSNTDYFSRALIQYNGNVLGLYDTESVFSGDVYSLSGKSSYNNKLILLYEGTTLMSFNASYLMGIHLPLTLDSRSVQVSADSFVSFSFSISLPLVDDDVAPLVLEQTSFSFFIGANKYIADLAYTRTADGSYTYLYDDGAVSRKYRTYDIVFGLSSPVESTGYVTDIAFDLYLTLPDSIVNLNNQSVSAITKYTMPCTTPQLVVSDTRYDAVLSGIDNLGGKIDDVNVTISDEFADLRNYLDQVDPDDQSELDQFDQNNSDFNDKVAEYSAAEANLQLDADLDVDLSKVSSYTDIFGWIFNNDLVLLFVLPVVSVATVAYVIYGKRG